MTKPCGGNVSKFNRKDIESALTKLAMLRYWPADPATRGQIGLLLAKMVPSMEALDWLVDTLLNRVGEWPGPKELRGLLCWKFRPADGIDAVCALPGFTPMDGEALYLEREQSWPELEPAAARKMIAGISGPKRVN